MGKIHIVINGVAQELAEGTTLENYATSKGIAEQRGTAIAINGKVIRRRDWAISTLADGDTVMLLTAAQGG